MKPGRVTWALGCFDSKKSPVRHRSYRRVSSSAFGWVNSCRMAPGPRAGEDPKAMRFPAMGSNWRSYPLVNLQKAMENGHRNRGFSHQKWWFSIATLNYQRVFHSWKCHLNILFQHLPLGRESLQKLRRHAKTQGATKEIMCTKHIRRVYLHCYSMGQWTIH